MNAHAYSEDQRRRTARHRAVFDALGWQTVSAPEETFGAGGMLGRETRGEVVLLPRLLSGQVAVDAHSEAISDSPACQQQ
jgi:type I restriction enzyme R subunit